MAQQTKSGLQTNLGTDLADNVTGNISAADVRENLIDFTDSVPFTLTANNVLSGSFSGSFQGDGSGLTGVTGEWDGTLNGNATITGSLTVTGNTNLGNDNADLLTVKGKAQMGYTTGTPSETSAVAIYDEDANYDYSLYTKGYNYFDTGDTSFNNHDLIFSRSTIYVGSNTLAPAVVPSSDSTNLGFAIARPDNETSQQLILSYQGGAGRIIGKETNANAPQIRFELVDSSTTSEVLRLIQNKTFFYRAVSVENNLGVTGNTTITGSLTVNNGVVVIENLPTTEPATSGQLWLSGSAGNSKYLMVRD